MNHLSSLLMLIVIVTTSLSVNAVEVNKEASINDTSTSIKGINHIGLSVKNLDQALAFYTAATGFEVIKREKVMANNAADKLYGVENLSFEVATLRAPNMLFELTEFNVNQDALLKDMPAQGPGMTHTCFQSPESDPGYAKFARAGARMLTRGDTPVDIGGYGVTYAYGYDPEGNLFEMEQLDGALLKSTGYDSSWAERGEQMWMSQVALVTPDIDKLMNYYQQVLGFQPYRVGEYANNEKMDAIVDIQGLALKGGWFKMNNHSKVMEFWQYQNPATPEFTGKRLPTTLGYTFSLEVTDIQQEYLRLKSIGVDFISEPVMLGEFLQVYARDIDGNIFALRQVTNTNSQYSVSVLDRAQ